MNALGSKQASLILVISSPGHTESVREPGGGSRSISRISSSFRPDTALTVHLDDGVVDLDTGCMGCVASGCMIAVEQPAGRATRRAREIGSKQRQKKEEIEAHSVIALSSLQRVRPAAHSRFGSPLF